MRIHFECWTCNAGIVGDFDNWVTLVDLRECPFCGSYNTDANEIKGEIPTSIKELTQNFVSDGYYVNKVEVVEYGKVQDVWEL